MTYRTFLQVLKYDRLTNPTIHAKSFLLRSFFFTILLVSTSSMLTEVGKCVRFIGFIPLLLLLLLIELFGIYLWQIYLKLEKIQLYF